MRRIIAVLVIVVTVCADALIPARTHPARAEICMACIATTPMVAHPARRIGE